MELPLLLCRSFLKSSRATNGHRRTHNLLPRTTRRDREHVVHTTHVDANSPINDGVLQLICSFLPLNQTSCFHLHKVGWEGTCLRSQLGTFDPTPPPAPYDWAQQAPCDPSPSVVALSHQHHPWHPDDVPQPHVRAVAAAYAHQDVVRR